MPLGRSLRCSHQHDRPELLSTPAQADRRGLQAPRSGLVPATRRATVRLNVLASEFDTTLHPRPPCYCRDCSTSANGTVLPPDSPRSRYISPAKRFLSSSCTVLRSRWYQRGLRSP